MNKKTWQRDVREMIERLGLTVVAEHIAGSGHTKLMISDGSETRIVVCASTPSDRIRALANTRRDVLKEFPDARPVRLYRDAHTLDRERPKKRRKPSRRLERYIPTPASDEPLKTKDWHEQLKVFGDQVKQTGVSITEMIEAQEHLGRVLPEIPPRPSLWQRLKNFAGKISDWIGRGLSLLKGDER